MNDSRSFDRAASYYDQTRPLPEPIATHGIQALVDLIGFGSRVLDVGTGTGRISIPLLERGLDLIGSDLSARMLGQLQKKHPTARLVQSDAARLPFPNAHFDFVMTVHVMHLVAPWREALHEFKRVLVPGGTYLNVVTWGNAGASIRTQVRQFWREWLQARGIDPRLPGVRDDEGFLQELRDLGARLTEKEVIQYPLRFTVREELERLGSRIYSDTWEIPDEMFEASMKEVWSWAEKEYRDLDQQRADEVRFAVDIAHFEAER